MEKTCLLVMGGAVQNTAALAKAVAKADYVVAADSGARHLLALDLQPDLLMGDMDSITNADFDQLSASSCRIKRFPSAKDDTDGALILKEAIALGYRSIELWGALGGRPDHYYANLMLLLLAETEIARSTASSVPQVQQKVRPYDIKIKDGGVAIYLPVRGQEIIGQPGDVISLFALGEPVTGFKNRGLKYQPPGDCYMMNEPLGISNELVGNSAWLDWSTGKLLCMHISIDKKLEETTYDK